MEKILEKLIEKDNLKTPVRKNNFSNFEDINLGKINIKIFGIGGAGCKVIMNMCQKQRWDNNIQLFALDTDVKLLKQIQYANYECQPHLLGKTICRGNGAGGDREIGKQIANSEIEDFKQFIKDTDLIFFIAGLGKGTGSGATPVFSKTARELGICTVNIVTLPSMYAEGKPVYQNSIDSYQEIADSCDAFYTLSNDKLYNIYNKDSLEYYESLERANVEIIKPIKLITNIMDCPNTNIGASDILTFFKNTKVFTVLSTSIKDNEQSYQTIMEHFNKALKKNCSIVGYANAKSAILYLTTTPKTSKSLIQDIKSVLASYPDNTNISMFTCTKRYDDTNDVQIEILISSNLQKEEALNNYDTSEIFLQSEDISMNGHMAQVPTDDDNPPDFRIFSNTLDVEPSEENDQSNDGIKIESWTDTSGFTHDNSNFVTTQKLTDKECTDILESVYLKAKK